MAGKGLNYNTEEPLKYNLQFSFTRIPFNCWIHTKKFNSMSDVSPFTVKQINVSLPARLNGTLLSATGVV